MTKLGRCSILILIAAVCGLGSCVSTPPASPAKPEAAAGPPGAPAAPAATPAAAPAAMAEASFPRRVAMSGRLIVASLPEPGLPGQVLGEMPMVAGRRSPPKQALPVAA
ncbi:MAG TPA: hypothetical protein VFL04_06750, partial [Rectinemataceae bacterium]|nr:hypothetical protein [Rectinemataceae bacterium]